MPDHIHLILRPREQSPNEYFDLGRIMKGIKGTLAQKINRLRNLTGTPFWQEESYNRMLRNSAEFRETFSYVVNNPVADGLCVAPEDYPFLILARPELRW